MIMVATITGDTAFPATAVWVQRKLGVSCPAFDVNAACAGFSYGLSAATAFINAGMADTVLLIGAEIFSRILDFTDRGPASCSATGPAPRSCGRPTRRYRGPVLGADGNAAEILLDAGGRHARAGDRRDGRGERSHGAHAERPRGLQARGHRDGRGVPRAPREERPRARRRRPADPPPGERAHHERRGRAPRHDPAEGRRRRGRGREHERRVDPDRARPRVACRARSARATWCCSPRSAPGSRGARPLVRWTIPRRGRRRARDARRSPSSPAPRGASAARARSRSPRPGWTVAVGYRSDEAAAKEVARGPRGRRHAGPGRLPRHHRRGERAGGVPPRDRGGRATSPAS